MSNAIVREVWVEAARRAKAENDQATLVMASIPCTRVRNGARSGKAGERGVYHLQTWPSSLAVGNLISTENGAKS